MGLYISPAEIRKFKSFFDIFKDPMSQVFVIEYIFISNKSHYSLQSEIFKLVDVVAEKVEILLYCNRR